MITVMIIAILLAVAIPTFVGIWQRAADRVTQTDLMSGYKASLIYYHDDYAFSGFDVAEGRLVDPALGWIGSGGPGGGAPAVGEIKIEEAESQDLLLIGRSRSGRFFCIG